ncbi:hypothetical protein [Hymenobacter terricola]|uniref:hypothetical protein n=1 Tax=Hymenobacter terricola TaxID=2819236 RepID=UPI001B3034F3|nr:hypothetical protein [Hymenobacter terricola]
MKFLVSAALLAATLTGANAPDSAPKPAVDLDPVYGANRSEIYHTHRVKEVFMDEEAFYNGNLTTERCLNKYHELDHAGRVTREETTHNRVIMYRHDFEYNAAGQHVATTTYAPLGGERKDTGRVGLA